MTIEYDIDEYGTDAKSTVVGNVPIGSPYLVEKIEKLDAAYNNKEVDFAYLAGTTSVTLAKYGDQITDRQGREYPISVHDIIVRKNGKWEMMTGGKAVETLKAPRSAIISESESTVTVSFEDALKGL